MLRDQVGNQTISDVDLPRGGCMVPGSPFLQMGTAILIQGRGAAAGLPN